MISTFTYTHNSCIHIQISQLICVSQTAADLDTWPKLRTSADVDTFIEESINDGADYIKLLQENGTALGFDVPAADLKLQTAIVSATHNRGLKAVAHALCLDETLICLRAGADGMTHTFFDQAPNQEVIDAYKKNNAWCSPTLLTLGSLTADGQALAEKFAHDPRVEGKLTPLAKERLCLCMNFKAEKSSFRYAIESVKMMKKEGIDVIA